MVAIRVRNTAADQKERRRGAMFGVQTFPGPEVGVVKESVRVYKRDSSNSPLASDVALYLCFFLL
jgi:hypothetical protein